jgi:hypothetical protein
MKHLKVRIISLTINTVPVIDTFHWLHSVQLHSMHIHTDTHNCHCMCKASMFCNLMYLLFTDVCILVCNNCLLQETRCAQTRRHAHFPCITTASIITTCLLITQLAGGNSILSQGKQLSSAQVPTDSTTAASVKPAGHTNSAEKKPQHEVTAAEDKPQHDAMAAEDSPITPLQSQPSQPQHSLYTPSNSDSRSHRHPSPATASASKLTGPAVDRSDASENGARPSILEAHFMMSSRAASSELGSDLAQLHHHQQQPQLRPAVAKPGNDLEAFSDQLDPQLSPPQSRPSSPRSQSAEGTSNDGNDHAVTHVNGYFDKSDEDNSSSSSRPDLSDQGTEEEGEEEAGRFANGSRNRSQLGADGDLACTLKVNLFCRISLTRTSTYLSVLYADDFSSGCAVP